MVNRQRGGSVPPGGRRRLRMALSCCQSNGDYVEHAHAHICHLKTELAFGPPVGFRAGPAKRGKKKCQPGGTSSAERSSPCCQSNEEYEANALTRPKQRWSCRGNGRWQDSQSARSARSGVREVLLGVTFPKVPELLVVPDASCMPTDKEHHCLVSQTMNV